ncbi:uncharacterized protein [Mytilus edulis]|uniref:uncharacterized protein n=1 Tax=Mytilus edulis TaxID=6550 RepID=UPI0039EFAAA9
MLGMATRIGRSCLRVNELFIKADFRRNSSTWKFIDNSSKIAIISTVAVGIGVTPIIAYTICMQNKFKPGDYDETFIYFGKGKVQGDVKVAVTEKGTTLQYVTDLHNRTTYRNTYAKCNKSDYTFCLTKGRNPKQTCEELSGNTIVNAPYQEVKSVFDTTTATKETSQRSLHLEVKSLCLQAFHMLKMLLK